MKLSSWNVNGIRAAMDKGFRAYVETEQPDVLCLQETKASADQVNTEWATELGYHLYWNSAEKKGYSGTSIWSKQKPTKVHLGIGHSDHDSEGRVLTATYDKFHLVNVYTPNAQRGLARLDYRQLWDVAFLDYVKKLNRRKPVIFCGDVNCAHREIDLANPKANRKNAGFSDEERAGLDNVCSAGFVDSFRHFDDSPEKYTWWTYRMNARERNIGWRLDYFWVAKRFMDQIESAGIRADILGSDHCPVELLIKSDA
ncbi:exodeoxyribonuclease III [Rhodopirellula sp. MGV]|uniref:exodeoxyribonuclease III n=1 Tax=Rhodopirellula sp. MGV TaxID=2023130 RepID=UPI000B95FF78|nr:exodeoxyribonuclease III [Rhodopirellula sp. MGV]OYP38869.1 exodeoxyribonuclease III [Rhodopirellula sp. MGV]PNY37680.1 exodeoxyribonuclease III [Rhodopirellula baltica]